MFASRLPCDVKPLHQRSKAESLQLSHRTAWEPLVAAHSLLAEYRGLASIPWEKHTQHSQSNTFPN